MTNSQKTLRKIMIYSLLIGLVPAALGILSPYIVGGDGGQLGLICGVIAGVCGLILMLTFIAFLISLVKASK